MILVLQKRIDADVVARGTLGYLPFFGDRGIGESANELLWERFGYGPAAIQMVNEHPIDGVGVGTFHSLSHDFGKIARSHHRQPDNAQNWFRHNIAELGIVRLHADVWWCVVL